VQVIQAVAGGELVGAPVALSAGDREEAVVLLRVSRVARVLGEPLDASTIAQLLGSISFGISEAGDPDVLAVAVPSWRSDVTREADLVEEVARLHGYDRFAATLRPSRPGSAPEPPLVGLVRRVREALVAAGLLETRPMPFTSGGDGGAGYVRLLNPLAENEAYLRRDVLDSLARRAEHNLAQMQRDLRLFEIGDAFAPGDGPLPREETRAAALIMGRRRPAHFTDPLAPELVDEWDAKSLAELVARTAFPAGTVTLAPADERCSGRCGWTTCPLAPSRAWRSTRRCGPRRPTASRSPSRRCLRRRPPRASPPRRSSPPPRLRRRGGSCRSRSPGAERDVTLVVPDELPAARVETVVRARGASCSSGWSCSGVPRERGCRLGRAASPGAHASGTRSARSATRRSTGGCRSCSARSRGSSVSDRASDRPVAAFAELQALVRHLGEELASFRGRALSAESRLRAVARAARRRRGGERRARRGARTRERGVAPAARGCRRAGSADARAAAVPAPATGWGEA
jgi:hypothetical protein